MIPLLEALVVRAFRSLAALLAFAATTVLAQGYPDRPIKLIVPFAAGGSTDTISRILAQKLTVGFGQPVVVENKPGAGGNLGADMVAKSPPDGYTLLFTGGAAAINVSLYSNLPFDLLKDFEPVIHVCNVTGILVTHPSVPVKSVQELVQLAKSKPGTLNFASAGSGTVVHMAGEMFRSMAHVDIVHVPYKGSGPALTDLIGGRVQLMFANMPGTLQFVNQGRLKLLAVTSEKRSSLVPDTPTIAESGLPGYQASSWFGIFAPAGTPREIVARLNAEIAKELTAPELADLMRKEGADAIGGSPEQFLAFVRSQVERWAPVVKAAGVKVN